MSFSFKRVMGSHRGRVFEKWIFDAHSPLLTSAAVGDIDADGNAEIVFGTKDGDVRCLDHEAKERWAFKTGNKPSGEDEYFYDLATLHSISSEPVLADINNDGKKEIIFGSDDGIVYALTYKGDLLWKYKIGGQIRSTPQVEDINNDGDFEIIVTSNANKLVVLSPQGKPIVQYKTPAPVESSPGILRGKNGSLSIIVFGMNDGKVCAIDTQENLLWEFETGDKVTAQPVFITHKNQTLILIGSWDGTLYALTTQGIMQWRYRTHGAIYHKAVIADINNDKKKEIVFGSCDHNIYALTLEGEKLWSYETDFWVMAHPILMDIDNDGAIEVIAGSFDNNVYILDGSGSYELEYVPGLSGIVQQAGHYADLLSSEPGERQGKKLWQYRTKGMVVGCSILTGEKHPQIIVNVKSGFVDSLSHRK